MIKVVKSYGNAGLHITLSKKDGYKVGDKVEINEKKNSKCMTDEEIESLIDRKIEEAKRGY